MLVTYCIWAWKVRQRRFQNDLTARHESNRPHNNLTAGFKGLFSLFLCLISTLWPLGALVSSQECPWVADWQRGEQSFKQFRRRGVLVCANILAFTGTPWRALELDQGWCARSIQKTHTHTHRHMYTKNGITHTHTHTQASTRKIIIQKHIWKHTRWWHLTAQKDE